jgi:hypothetical protein
MVLSWRRYGCLRAPAWRVVRDNSDDSKEATFLIFMSMGWKHSKGYKVLGVYPFHPEDDGADCCSGHVEGSKC